MDGAGRGGALDPIMAKLEEAEAAVETRVPFELLWGRLGRHEISTRTALKPPKQYL